MSLLSTLQHTLRFTPNEMKVILILAGTFLAGVGVRWYQSDMKVKSVALRHTDYSRSDSIFLARSRAGNRNESSRRSPGSPHPNGKDPKAATDDRPVNINTASKTDLMGLPGIGPAYAERILKYRKQHGAFGSVDDLKRIAGIGRKKMERLRSRVTIN